MKTSRNALYGTTRNTEPHQLADDPNDRTALMGWFGAAGVVNERGGRLDRMRNHARLYWPAHEGLGVDRLGGDTPRPDWSKPLVDELFLIGSQKIGQPPEVVLRDMNDFLKGHRRALGSDQPAPRRDAMMGWNQDTLLGSCALLLLAGETSGATTNRDLQSFLGDLQSFLAGHQRMCNPPMPPHQRVARHTWNSNISLACCLMEMLAQEAPEKVPAGLIDDLIKFQGSYEASPFHQDVQQKVLARKEKKILEDFVASIPHESSSPATGDGGAEGKRKPSRTM